VCANSAPKNVRLAFHNRFSVGERRSPVVGPSHLENTWSPSHTFYAQAVSESASRPEVLYEGFDRFEELGLLFSRQVVKVDTKACQPEERWQWLTFFLCLRFCRAGRYSTFDSPK
jgi:hypothetical protein